MKRVLLVVFVLLLVLSLSLFAFADGADWPPKNYDMPRVVMETSDYAGFFSSLKTTIGSIVNVGFVILGFCVSVGLIASIFSRVVNIGFGSRPRSSVSHPEHSEMNFDRSSSRSYHPRESSRSGSGLEESLFHRQLNHTRKGRGD